jgi:hypothetical protein
VLVQFSDGSWSPVVRTLLAHHLLWASDFTHSVLSFLLRWSQRPSCRFDLDAAGYCSSSISFEFVYPARLLLRSCFRFCTLGFAQDSVFVGFSDASACEPRASSFFVRFLHQISFPVWPCHPHTQGYVFLPAQFFRPSLLLVPTCCSSRASPGSSSRVCARSSEREAPARGESLDAVVVLTRSSSACLCARGELFIRPCLAFF